MGICSKETEIDTILLSPEEIQYLSDQDDSILTEILLGKKNRLYKTYALEEMWQRKGADFVFFVEHENVTLSQFAQNLYELQMDTGKGRASSHSKRSCSLSSG